MSVGVTRPCAGVLCPCICSIRIFSVAVTRAIASVLDHLSLLSPLSHHFSQALFEGNQITTTPVCSAGWFTRSNTCSRWAM
jgi:hypothetical protein